MVRRSASIFIRAAPLFSSADMLPCFKAADYKRNGYEVKHSVRFSAECGLRRSQDRERAR